MEVFFYFHKSFQLFQDRKKQQERKFPLKRWTILTSRLYHILIVSVTNSWLVHCFRISSRNLTIDCSSSSSGFLPGRTWAPALLLVAFSSSEMSSKHRPVFMTSLMSENSSWLPENKVSLKRDSASLILIINVSRTWNFINTTIRNSWKSLISTSSINLVIF